ncbi:MAG: hypothetical protein WBR10_09535 [Candidatus Acidiferrum sp.]
MGNWYTNVSVKGAQQANIVAVLEELGRCAYVTPETAGWIVVYDQQTDEFDLGILESLALTLSMRLACTTLASCNADDDVLWLALYENGSLATRYASSRKSFEDGDEFPELKESAEVLARVFQRPETKNQVLRVLGTSHGVLGLLRLFLKLRIAYITEVQRHLDLSNLLGMPLAAVGLGYRYVNKGETPEGIDRAALRRTMVG